MSGQTLTDHALPYRWRRWTITALKHSSARRFWLPWLVGAGVVLVLALAAGNEMQTSDLQSQLATDQARKFQFTVKPGTSDAISYPDGGPYDQRLGYSGLPRFVAALKAQHFVITSQARQSADMLRFRHQQNYALYREKQHAGFLMRDRDGRLLYATDYPERSYDRFASVPSLVVRTLSFIEDRQLLDARYPHYNPAVEWKRFLRACLGEMFGWLDPHLRAGGASTLATQIEKFRHSPGGRTQTAFQKIEQMQAATLRAYLDGPDTLSARKHIVVTYLDSTPLGSRPGYGEIIGVGDGLRVWYGTDFDEANHILSDPNADPGRKAQIYKQVLSLLLAERRPTYYLQQDPRALGRLTNRYLLGLARSGVIGPALRDTALRAELRFQSQAPAPASVSYIGRKATDAVRTQLLERLHVPSYYSLDHLDLRADTTIDTAAQKRVTDFLARLRDPVQVHDMGLEGKDLLGGGNPADVNYSVVLYERGTNVNYVRVHADSLNEPFDINSGTKLQLGSTAKLRTLVTYLQIITELHARLGASSPQALRKLADGAADPLTQWAADYLAHASDRRLQPMLDAAMQRKYSASPAEAFFTGSGEHVFHNFEKSEDYEKPTVAEATARSINLAFIRIMRDIERYTIAQGQLAVRAIRADDAMRQTYLRRFADQEGRAYLSRFYKDLKPLTPDQRLARLAQRTGPYARRLVIVYRSVRPKAGLGEVNAFLKRDLGRHFYLDKPLDQIYDKYAVDKFSLPDRGYLTRVHPLELWLAAYLERHPDASRRQVLDASKATRQDVYGWLFKTRNPHKQDMRIRILVEQDAFKRIWQYWHAQGYPFAHLVPSLATAIGSSGDRPDALADLMGIILNNGVRQPTIDVQHLQFAAGTPYETDMAPEAGAGVRVIAPEIATTVRRALMNVMVEGTGKHFENAYTGTDGQLLAVGGKTGTGDNRFDVFAGANRLIESRVVDRTSTFVFFLGNSHFGTITAYVPGHKAAQFHFTSALAVQLLERLTPAIEPLLRRDAQAA